MAREIIFELSKRSIKSFVRDWCPRAGCYGVVVTDKEDLHQVYHFRQAKAV